MYKNSDSKYDRSVYLELYTGSSGYDRTLAGNRHFVDMPRFNLCDLDKQYLELINGCHYLKFFVISEFRYKEVRCIKEN
ncbi:hypothetical protein BpHYR1_008223 [Brachionus plicatilis]|uniref:Uncharacterized protein n=1 Tax=Brachionus plicatilis TaxID=10195 RepID=A0A3M7T648_BRAPC|nr:hypothetical protein BpHYR1_008223 [Brachionus plicatilis]